MVLELNHCVEVLLPISFSLSEQCKDKILTSVSHSRQEILRANAYIKTAADLAMKYRKNVQYNLEANKPEGDQ
jgi:DASH complex subunit DAD4